MPTISFEQFAERHNVRIATAEHKGRHKDADGWEHDRWSLILTDDDAGKIDANSRHMHVSFRMGTGHEGQCPTVEEVLQSLALDANSVQNADDFEEWVSEYDYDTDSRKAEALYHGCVEQTEALLSWLGEGLFLELLECEEDGDEPEADELHRRFDDEILPLVKKQYEQDGIADYPARCEAFNDWIDSLNKDGEISDWLAANIEHPESCGR